MAYSNIIVVLTGERDDERAMSAAAELATQSRGIVRVLQSFPIPANSVWSDAFGVSAFSDSPNTISAANAKRARDVTKVVEGMASKFGLASGPGCEGPSVEFAHHGETAWLALMREGPMADIVLLGGSLIEFEGFWGSVASDALLSVRVPILIVRTKGPVLGGRAAIFWDGSLPAGRAVRSATPLLNAASHVTIFQDPRGMNAEEREAGDPLKLIAELNRRGIEKVSVVGISQAHDGETLLAAAHADQARLIVSGAYGHSRLGEAVFGGATKAFLRADWDVNHLVAH